MIIDTHVHAFPPLSHHTKALPGPLRAGIEGVASVAARIAAVGRNLAPSSPLGVERLARWRKRGPRPVLDWTELGMGIAMFPSLAMSGTLPGLVDSMNRHGIDRSVVIAGVGAAPNKWLLREARDADGRIIPVAHPPQLGPDALVSDFEDALLDLANEGARGFKIHHNMDGLPVDAPVYRAMFEVAAARGLFIIVHTGCFHVAAYKHLRPVTPETFDALFQEYPTVRVCLAHMNRDDPEAAWTALRRHDQLWVDTSWQTTESVRRALDAVGPARVVLGSDWPLLHRELQGESLRVLERAATDAELAVVTGDAAVELIGGLD